MQILRLKASINTLIAITALVVFGSAISAQAQAPKHPGYIHALHDLRAARALLLVNHDQSGVLNQAYAAVHEIDSAIDEIKSAAVLDGKDVKDNPPIDAGMQPRDRFAKALDFLHAAHTDCDYPEQDAKAAGIRDRALKHIDAATSIVTAAIPSIH